MGEKEKGKNNSGSFFQKIVSSIGHFVNDMNIFNYTLTCWEIFKNIIYRVSLRLSYKLEFFLVLVLQRKKFTTQTG
jgi:hypothetical protein